MVIGFVQLPVMATFLFIGYGFLGLVIPTAGVLALEDHGEIAGTASALMGTLQFVVAAFAMAIAGLFFNGTALPMAVGIGLCAICTFILTQVTIARKTPVTVEMAAE